MKYTREANLALNFDGAHIVPQCKKLFFFYNWGPYGP